MTWYQLFNKLGKQPLYKTQHKNVTVLCPDGKEYNAKLQFDNHGSDFHLVITNEGEVKRQEVL